MADPHDTQHQGRGFWGCANIFLASAFGAFAAIAGGALIIGGMTPASPKKEAPAAASTSTSSAPAPLLEVTLKPGSPNPMSYDITLITARAGQKVKITFQNQSTLAPLQHSLLICKPGSRERMFALADSMMTDMPKWLAKGFIPETPDVLHHTKLLNPGESETLEFTAGPEKGDYPYLCTFPGHSRIMQGTLKVE
jgi:azurin